MEKCVFVGYPSGYKGWKFYNPTTRKFIISERAEFDKRVFPGLSTYKASSPVDLTPPGALPLAPEPIPAPMFGPGGIVMMMMIISFHLILNLHLLFLLLHLSSRFHNQLLRYLIHLLIYHLLNALLHLHQPLLLIHFLLLLLLQFLLLLLLDALLFALSPHLLTYTALHVYRVSQVNGGRLSAPLSHQ